MRPRKFFTICLLALTYVITAGNGEGCSIYEGQVQGYDFRFAIAPQTIPDGGIFGGVLSALGITFPFESAIPSTAEANDKVTEVYLTTLALRSTRADDFDSNGSVIDANLKDASRVNGCATNQKNLNFLKKLELFLKKPGTTGNPVRIAHYTKASSSANICGFFMELDNDPATGGPYNLKQFLPHPEVSTKAEGSAPPTEVKLTGFVSVDWFVPEGEIIIPPPDQNGNQN